MKKQKAILMEKVQLKNGLTLEFWDESKHLVGDTEKKAPRRFPEKLADISFSPGFFQKVPVGKIRRSIQEETYGAGIPGEVPGRFERTTFESRAGLNPAHRK